MEAAEDARALDVALADLEAGTLAQVVAMVAMVAVVPVAEAEEVHRMELEPKVLAAVEDEVVVSAAVHKMVVEREPMELAVVEDVVEASAEDHRMEVAEQEPKELAAVEGVVAESEEVHRKDEELVESAVAEEEEEEDVSAGVHTTAPAPREQVLGLCPNPQCHFPIPEAEKAPTAACNDSHPPGDLCPGGRHPRGHPLPRAGPPEAENSATRQLR